MRERFRNNLVWIFRFRITLIIMCAVLFFVLIPALIRKMGITDSAWTQASCTYGGILILVTALPRGKKQAQVETPEELGDIEEEDELFLPSCANEPPEAVSSGGKEKVDEINRIVTYRGKKWLCPSSNTDVKNN